MKFTALILTGILLALPITAQTTRLVPSQHPTIQSAIAASVSGDTILVSPGTYAGAINYLGKNVAIASTGGASVTTLTSTGGRVVTFTSNESASASLTGFTITGTSGGMRIQGASPTITSCRFLNCFVAGFGAGVFITTLTNIAGSTAAPTFTQCDFVGCLSTNSSNGGPGGGGMSVRETYSGSHVGSQTLAPTLIDCVFTGNFAFDGSQGSGGGLEVATVYGTTLAISCIGCEFRFNAAANGGGAYVGSNAATSASAAFSACKFIENDCVQTSGQGGGLCAIASSFSLTVSNCLFSGNSSFNSGGGASIFVNPPALFSHCTVAGNSSNFLGGGVYAGSAVNFVNSILWGNSLFDVYCFVTTTGTFPAVPTYSTIGSGLFAPSPTNLSVDPLFVDTANGDFHLAPNSPCKNVGSAAAALPAFDFDGDARVVGGTPDMGVDEIPALGMPGTGDDLELFAWMNDTGDPLATSRTGAAYDILRLLLRSPGGAFVGVPPLIVGEVFLNASPPVPPAGVPFYLSSNVFILFGSTVGGPLSLPGLSPTGVELFLQAPPGLAGLTFRAQGATIGGPALNGLFALTRATEVVF